MSCTNHQWPQCPRWCAALSTEQFVGGHIGTQRKSSCGLCAAYWDQRLCTHCMDRHTFKADRSPWCSISQTTALRSPFISASSSRPRILIFVFLLRLASISVSEASCLHTSGSVRGLTSSAISGMPRVHGKPGTAHCGSNEAYKTKRTGTKLVSLLCSLGLVCVSSPWPHRSWQASR